LNERESVSLIEGALADSARLKERLREQAAKIASIAGRLADTFRGGSRLYACGNGGSACDAMHFVEELVARYKADRPGLPAHHLLDAATLSCWSNDYEYATAFRRQVETLMRPGDVLVALSTSGNSPNVVLAAEAARSRGSWVLALTGEGGGRLAEVSDEILMMPSIATERIQEGHITVIHIFCELLERTLFSEPAAPAVPDRETNR
jgi:D-sedoheptulose 7-phosphate isomerase